MQSIRARLDRHGYWLAVTADGKAQLQKKAGGAKGQAVTVLIGLRQPFGLFDAAVGDRSEFTRRDFESLGGGITPETVDTWVTEFDLPPTAHRGNGHARKWDRQSAAIFVLIGSLRHFRISHAIIKNVVDVVLGREPAAVEAEPVEPVEA